MNNILTEVQAALRDLGHDAEPVRGADNMLNVWVDGEGRYATATVRYDPGDPANHGQLVWGHRWEHRETTAIGAEALAERIVATAKEAL